MNEILNFVANHWLASGIFVALLAGYAVFEFMQGTNSKQVSPEQAVQLLNHEHALILDVRSAEEFASGHILGSMHLALGDIESSLKKLQKYVHKPVITVCAMGKRSAKAMSLLEANGFTKVQSMAGGLSAWQESGLPLDK